MKITGTHDGDPIPNWVELAQYIQLNSSRVINREHTNCRQPYLKTVGFLSFVLCSLSFVILMTSDRGLNKISPQPASHLTENLPQPPPSVGNV
ncbi:hypothetical protein [Scytonema sp. NUACC21]